MSCDENNTPPTLVITEAEGTAPCPENDTTTPVQCPIDACCDYFKLLQEADGQSFVISGGGPFAVGDPICDRVDVEVVHCPPDDVDGLPNLFYLTTGEDDPGPLGGVICLDNMTPGTYKICARWTMRNAEMGARAVMMFRKDCAVAEEICIADCMVPCLSDQELIDFTDQETRDITCYDCLYVTIDTCSPGIRFLAAQGCAGEGGVEEAVIEGIQINVTRISSRDLETCGGIPLLTCDMTLCDSGPELLSCVPANGEDAYIGATITFVFAGHVTVVSTDLEAFGAGIRPCTGWSTPTAATAVPDYSDPAQTTITVTPTAPLNVGYTYSCTIVCSNGCATSQAYTCFTTAIA